MTNPNSGEEEIVKSMRRIENAERVIGYVKEPLQEMIRYEEGKTFLAASDDLLMLLVFTYVDLLGYLYKGSNSSLNAVKFMREYFGRVDQRYQEGSGLIYDALRHGMVHLATPKRIQLQDGKILDFLFRRFTQREDYLKIRKMQEKQENGVIVDIYRLTLDISLLYEDLLSAIDKYAEDIRNDQGLSATFSQAFETRRKPEKAKEKELLKKPYIRESDFAFVMGEISNL